MKGEMEGTLTFLSKLRWNSELRRHSRKVSEVPACSKGTGTVVKLSHWDDTALSPWPLSEGSKEPTV